MSRNQSIIVVVLSVAVVSVFGCLIVIGLGYWTGDMLRGFLPNVEPFGQGADAASTSTPIPSPTLSPEYPTKRTIPVRDAEFLDCSRAVVRGINEVNNLALEVLSTGDPATGQLLASMAFEVLTKLDNCQEPTDPRLRDGKELLGVGLDDLLTAGAMLADGNPSGYEFLAEGSASVNSGLRLLTDYVKAQQ